MQISFGSSVDYSSHGRERAQGDDLAAVSRGDLRWYYFLGTLHISHGGTEIGPSWGWVPLFDAMYGVHQVMTFARGGPGSGRIEFTENDEFIEFRLDRDRKYLRVVPSYMGTEVSCGVDDFITAGRKFIRDEVARVTTEYPSLAENHHVQLLRVELGLDGTGT
ncbi:hypothetical protein AB0D34_42410 [Streptomyces sp. NPDC048420]|uniref:hypothetical protein n=1 Tax=Streptomyces sp. NPDC048420 TaxID=3155755 RepID=UPI00344A72FD